MIIIGGLGSIIGSVFGAVFMILLPKLLSVATTVISADFPSLTRLVMAFEQGIFGLIIVLFLIFEPDGLAHRWKQIKAYWKLYPFSY
jgi:branched-chain amino acid transport system permease protein